MKKIVVLLLAALFCGSAFAQTVLTPHLTETSKKIAIPADAAVFPEIHDGLITVGAYPNLFYVKPTGEYVWGKTFPFSRATDYVTPYFSGGAMMGWRTKEGAYSASPFILHPDGTKYEFPTGTKNAAGMSYDVFAASSFVEGYALVRRGNMMSSTQIFIDKNGKEVFPALKSSMRGTMGDMTVYPVREGRRVYYNAELKKYGYADAQGNIVIKPTFDKAHSFSDGMAAVMINENYTEKWGFIDKTGKLVIPATYRLAPGRFSEGIAAVRIGDSDYGATMNYIDKTGKLLMAESQPWGLNEFHDGYAWVATGCDKLFVMNREFVETADVTKAFYQNGNGMGVCSFTMKNGDLWGIDFPNGRQALNQQGLQEGDVFASDGTWLFHAVDAKGRMVLLHAPTAGGLMFCKTWFDDKPLQCFINEKGEIVYYFVEE